METRWLSTNNRRPDFCLCDFSEAFLRLSLHTCPHCSPPFLASNERICHRHPFSQTSYLTSCHQPQPIVHNALCLSSTWISSPWHSRCRLWRSSSSPQCPNIPLLCPSFCVGVGFRRLSPRPNPTQLQ